MKTKMVLVKWQDSAATDPAQYFSVGEIKDLKPITMYDVGFLNEGKDVLVLAANMSENGVQRRAIIIPRKNVIKIVGLREGK